jgi:hypothetical protein
MLVVAFICFFVLIVAWLLAPNAAPRADLVTPVTRTAMASESGSASLA